MTSTPSRVRARLNSAGRAAQAGGRRLRRHTIWEPGAIPRAELKYAGPLKRVALPLYDLVAIWAGVKAVLVGIPAVEVLMPHTISDAISWTFAIVAFLCLVGISYPKLWLLEAISKVLLLSMLSVYYTSLVALSGGSEPGRSFVSTIVVLASIIIGVRLWIIGLEWRDRKDEAELDKALGEIRAS